MADLICTRTWATKIIHGHVCKGPWDYSGLLLCEPVGKWFMTMMTFRKFRGCKIDIKSISASYMQTNLA